MASTTADPPSQTDDVRVPSVLVVLVAKDGAAWLRECLQSLSAQTHPRLGVIAVDNGSTDGSRELLERALGSGRLISLPGNPGLAGSVRAALELPVAQEADYLLILHDDAALASDAVGRLVEAAERIEGIEQVGIVGPKVVDWDNPRILREVGRSTDRFGHPYTPLQDGEMDHGQYDRVLEVLFVSSCAMLVSRDAWQRTGLPDERLDSHNEDLDLCWRARLAGFRVLMTPLSQARHRGASVKGERETARRRRSARYYAERAGLAAMLKNYGVLSLLWLLPLYVVLGLGRLSLLAASRRFEDAYELLAAWGWNLAHLPGTFRRRIRAQSVRKVSDRSVRRFMESASLRLPRWFESAGDLFAEQRALGSTDEEEAHAHPPLRARAASLAGTHPAIIAWVLVAVVAAMAYRDMIGPQVLQGGVLPGFPARSTDFFHELVSGIRSTPLGGAQSASPALALLGGISWLAFDSPALAQKLLLALLPPIAGVVLYRALIRQSVQPAAAVTAAACYGLSAVVLWAFSQGRFDILVAFTVLPNLAERLDAAFGPDRIPSQWRFAAGVGVALAIGVAFLPGILLALAVMIAVRVVSSRRPARGLTLAVTSLGVGAVLVFPVVPDLVAGVGASLSSHVGQADFASLGRLSLGAAPGSWAVSWFLPAAALLSFSVVGPDQRGRAYRALLTAVAALFLAWGSAAGYLPTALSNPPVYVGLAAVSEAAIVAYGLSTLFSGIELQSFGYRQVAAAALTGLLLGGLALQAAVAATGGWDIGPNRLPPAWPVLASSPPEAFRVLWLGRVDQAPFPAPGGDPRGIVEAGQDSIQYAITDRDGVTSLDTGRGAFGSAYDFTERALGELLSGTTDHAGTLLGLLGVRYVVAASGDLPRLVVQRLDEQFDLDLVPAGGLVVYRNAAALPPAAAISSADYAREARRVDLLSASSLPPADADPLQPLLGGWRGTTEQGGMAFLAGQYDPGWSLSAAGRKISPFPAFGWATAFDLQRGGVFTVTYSRQWVRNVEMIALGLLWAVALWITRKQVPA